MTITINGTTGLAGVDGSAGTPAIQGGDTNTGVFFPAADTVGVATGGTERMRVDSSGNVGIGTSSPSQKLTLGSGFAQTGNGIGGAGGVWFPYGADAGTRSWRARTDIVGYGDFGFEQSTTQTGTTFATKMLIDASGNLLVGTTSNFGKFTVSSACNTVKTGLVVSNTDTGAGTFAGFLNSAGNTAGSITQTGTTTVNYGTSSDYRLKTEIFPMEGALAKVEALKPCTYKWKDDGASGEGFIAHELAEIAPQCVVGKKDAVDAESKPIYQTIDTSFLVATLTAAIQEQQALITALTERIEVLEAK